MLFVIGVVFSFKVMDEWVFRWYVLIIVIFIVCFVYNLF